MPDHELTIGVNILNLEEVKELRKELERIKELEKEEDSTTHPTDFPDIGDPNPNPSDPFTPEKTPKRPRFWVSLDSDGEVTEFDPFENEDDVKAETSFQV